MTTATRLKNHDTLEAAPDECPMHGGEVRKIYRFGAYEDSEVRVYNGCKCAVCERLDPVGILPAAVTFHTSYNDAHGVAKLHALMMNAKWR